MFLTAEIRLQSTPPLIECTVRVFRQKFTLKDAIELHSFASLEANRRVTNAIPLGRSPLLPVHTVVNCVQKH
jgi:hypothetical protein